MIRIQRFRVPYISTDNDNGYTFFRYHFSKDTINGPKVIAKFAKKHENLVIKGGLVEGKMMNADQIKVIASLPGREGLISMFLSCLQAPIRNFACAVKAVAEKN